MEERGGILSAVTPVTGHTSQSFPNSTTTGDEAFKYESVWGPLLSKPPHNSMRCLLYASVYVSLYEIVLCLGHFCNSDVWFTCNHAMLSSFVNDYRLWCLCVELYGHTYSLWVFRSDCYSLLEASSSSGTQISSDDIVPMGKHHFGNVDHFVLKTSLLMPQDPCRLSASHCHIAVG